jgi:hypothetical protein
LQQDYKDAFKFHLNQSVKPIIIQFFALASGLHPLPLPLPTLLFFFFFFNHWALALDSLHLCCFIVRWKLLILVMIQPFDTGFVVVLVAKGSWRVDGHFEIRAPSEALCFAYASSRLWPLLFSYGPSHLFNLFPNNVWFLTTHGC